MTTDTAALLLILGAAPAITLFAIIYGFTSPWHRSLIGCALFVSSTGMAMLIDISILYHYFGDNYAFREVVRLFVYSWVFGGSWLKFAAIVSEKVKARRGRGADRFASVDGSRGNNNNHLEGN